MRLSLRLIAILATGVTLLTLAVTWADVRAEQAALGERLRQQAQAAAERPQPSIEPALRRGGSGQATETLERFASREDLAGAALWDGARAPLAATPLVARALGEQPEIVPACDASAPRCGAFVSVNDLALFAYSVPLH